MVEKEGVRKEQSVKIKGKENGKGVEVRKETKTKKK